MAANDRFAELALHPHPVNRDELQESFLPVIPAFKLSLSDKAAPPMGEKTYEELLVDFNADLAALKAKYRPFTEDHTPHPEQFFYRIKEELSSFDFRYEEKADQEDFSRVLNGGGSWVPVSIPDYRGPIGRWTGFYRTVFSRGALKPGRRLFLRFLSVDYKANVSVNGRFVGSHEGFFSPFEFDITDFLQKENILVVEVKNDAPTLGLEYPDGSSGPDGDKLYAATGPGWDDSAQGWHHCPPGAGIFNRVILEERPELFVHDLFVRPDIDNARAEAWVELYNCPFKQTPFELTLEVYPFNFDGSAGVALPCQAEPAGPGHNYYRFILPMPDFRLWDPQTPWLYTLQAKLKAASPDGYAEDEAECRFGMRQFRQDETEKPYGTLYLNNRRIFLRGANDMGHMQQCVMRGDFEQLTEDILIAKLANMNYYRFTQRPVQEEIYRYCDMLGMMNQTDLPVFGYFRRNQFAEGVRQAGEMERLIRSHPSSIMISYINEPFSAASANKGHRHLYRDELEAFFEAASRAVRLENPDRVIKNAEGDYDPPTREGLSDFHCYNMWYTNHALPVGKLHKGYLPALRRDRKTGCGEYGTEGLDPLEVMLEDYPKSWVPKSLTDSWTPEHIVRAQTYSMHGDWYEEQDRILNWIDQSQRHQALATRIMTDAFRRRADLIVSTAVHLLIDAWPSGWMKTLVDHRRKPKPAYFEFQKANVPLRVNIRTDRFRLYQGEPAEAEVWILNDLPAELRDYAVTATVRSEEEVIASYSAPVNSAGGNASCLGLLSFTVPAIEGPLYIDAALTDREGCPVNQERLVLSTYKRQLPGEGSGAILIEFPGQFDRKAADPVLSRVREGADAVFLMDTWECGAETYAGWEIKTEKMNGVYFVARNPYDPLTADFGPQDFSYPYGKAEGYIRWTAEKYLSCDNLVPLLYSYRKPAFGQFSRGEKVKLPVLAYGNYGKGRLYFTTIPLRDIAGVNPCFDKLMARLNLYLEGNTITGRVNNR
ncbi:MAG: hypothetical protein LBQ38_00805 [Spirochaetaceae bacterium]|jgi:hypothetical protein|nr:hypothetical protein [Spirochaetaceae bacterium]